MKLKKLFASVLSISILLCFAACTHNDTPNPNQPANSTSQSTEKTVEQNIQADVTKSNEISTQNGLPDSYVGGTDDEFNSPFDDYKYRAIYYSISEPFAQLVDKDVYWDWLDNETPYRTFPLENIEEMAMVAFIKKFNISREDFDKANEEHKRLLLEYGGIAIMNPAEEDPYYDRDIECREIYNADIIYTFDNELINSYYLYVDPYAEETSSNSTTP